MTTRKRSGVLVAAPSGQFRFFRLQASGPRLTSPYNAYLDQKGGALSWAALDLWADLISWALYLEWFSNFNGRVVIQSTRLAVERLGERAFELTDNEWAEQAYRNREELTFFLHQLCDAIDRQLPPDRDD